MKVNYRRLAAGRESERHYDSGYSRKRDARREERRDNRGTLLRQALAQSNA